MHIAHKAEKTLAINQKCKPNARIRQFKRSLKDEGRNAVGGVVKMAKMGKMSEMGTATSAQFANVDAIIV